MTLDSKSQQQWLTVTKLMKKEPSISLGDPFSLWYRNDPTKLLDSLTYYKFAAKLIGKSKKVLDIGCGSGFGTFLLGKECGWAEGIDIDSKVVATGKTNFSNEITDFHHGNILQGFSGGVFDAIVCFSLIEHFSPASALKFWQTISQSLKPEGLLILGTPSIASCAMDVAPPINLYTSDRLEAEISQLFHYVFSFGANGEVIHTSSLSSVEYLIMVGCKKRI